MASLTGLSARRAQRLKSRGKSLQLKVRAKRAPRLLVHHNTFQSFLINILLICVYFQQRNKWRCAQSFPRYHMHHPPPLCGPSLTANHPSSSKRPKMMMMMVNSAYYRDVQFNLSCSVSRCAQALRRKTRFV